MITLRVLARLLDYPQAEVRAAIPELRDVLEREARLPAAVEQGLNALLDELQERPLTASQENYVSLFDRGRHLSLHLFEHVHGESRDRGQAMVDLIEHYRSCGDELDARELPDHLPLFLEFLSTQPDDEIIELLADAMPVLVLLGARLRERDSAYAAIFEALETLGGSCEDADDMRRQAATEGPDQTIERMDEIWEEEQVTFLGNNDPADGGCASETVPREVPVQWIDRRPSTAERN